MIRRVNGGLTFELVELSLLGEWLGGEVVWISVGL